MESIAPLNLPFEFLWILIPNDSLAISVISINDLN